MQLPPLSVLTAFPKSNYVDPVVRGPALIIITTIMFPITLFMVILRVYTRIRVTRSFGLDDTLLVLAILPTTGCAVLTLLADLSWQWERHVWDVEARYIIFGLKMKIVLECLFAAAVSFTKLSMLVLTLRFLPYGRWRQTCVAGLWVVSFDGIIFICVVIFTCRPISLYWTLSFGPQECIDERIHLLAGGILNIVTDFLVFLLPVPVFWGLRMSYRERIILVSLFSNGLIVCLAGALRTYYAWIQDGSFDKTWDAFPLWIVSMVEMYLGLMVASLVAMKPFFSRYLPRLIYRDGKRSTFFTGDLKVEGAVLPKEKKFSTSTWDEKYEDEKARRKNFFLPSPCLSPAFTHKSFEDPVPLTRLVPADTSFVPWTTKHSMPHKIGFVTQHTAAATVAGIPPAYHRGRDSFCIITDMANRFKKNNGTTKTSKPDG